MRAPPCLLPLPSCIIAWGSPRPHAPSLSLHGAPPQPSFPELEAEMREAIAELGGAVFPKLNWSAPKVRLPLRLSPLARAFASGPHYCAPPPSPPPAAHSAQDATWISTTGTLKCDSPSEVFVLLKSSDFVVHDLAHACASPSSLFPFWPPSRHAAARARGPLPLSRTHPPPDSTAATRPRRPGRGPSAWSSCCAGGATWRRRSSSGASCWSGASWASRSATTPASTRSCASCGPRSRR